MDDTLARVKGILLGMEHDDLEITADTQIAAHLGIDSMSMLELISKTEREFRVVLGDRDVNRVVTVGDLAGLVDRLRSAAAPSK